MLAEMLQIQGNRGGRLLHQRIEAMWWSKRFKPNPILRALSKVYLPLFRFNQQSRINHKVKPAIPLISVGNITVGGSGKTPFVVWLAQALKARGFSPVLLSRGDGANNQTPHLVSEYSKAHEVGDEAVLLFRLSGCPVIAGRDRILGAEIAASYGDVMILDDGFQYRQLERVCDIVMVPAEGVGNGYLLPAGPLREPVGALERADIVVRSGKCEALSNKKEWVWQASSQSIHAWNDVIAQTLNPLEQPIHVVTGIARPVRVINDLKSLGFEIAEHTNFIDHHAYTADDITSMFQIPYPIVTTAKDAVKLLPLWPTDKPLWVLEQKADAEEGLLDEVVSFIQSKKAVSSDHQV